MKNILYVFFKYKCLFDIYLPKVKLLLNFFDL